MCNILSMYDTVNHRTAYQLYSIYTGLLRGAKYMDVRITDTVTGEVLYEERQTNIRKAYSGGSTTASAANVLLELSPLELGLANNRKYQFEMSGVMDHVLGQGDYPEKREEDSFSFTFYVDNEAPELVDYRVRFDPYKDGKETKYKVYLDMDIYDNHYAQSVALCYLNNDEMQLELLSGDWIPVESTRGGTTTVSVDITDYYDSDIDMYIQVDDYAMNTHAYHLTNWKTLAEAVVYPESITVNDGDVTMNIGEAKELSVSVTPADAAATNLYWTSSNEKVVRVQNGELYGVGTGTATVTVYGAANTATQNKTSIKVTVTDQVSTEQIRLESLKLGLIRNKDGAMVDPTSMCDVHPNTTYVLQVSADPWYFPGELDIRFSSSAPDVASVDEKTGVVHTLREGTAYITAAQYVDGKESAFSVTAKLNVGPEPDTKAAIDAINAMPTVEAIQALTSMTDKDAAMKLLAEYKALVSAARIAYNRVANADQRAFITNADVLFRTETVMRETRKAMGETVTIRDLQVKVSPNKLVYTAGELFDATGMVLTVIYDDGSEEDVTSGFVLPQTPLRAGQQTVTFTYAGIEKEISLTVNRGTESETTGNDTEETTSSPDETTAPDESTGSSDTSEETGDAANTGCGKGCGSVMASALTLPLLAAAAFAVLRIRKKEEEEEEI